MPLGPKPNVEALSRGLDPFLLRLLARDLLSERGFRELRDFDGVGDGGRDLEGLAPDGGPCVIQLKYREDPNATTAANEFGELPLAMLRLGRTRGLFVTNGRITSPAKRDAVNAYPGLALKFMEGVDLLDELTRAPITTALWCDGVDIRHIQRRVRFGVVCRSLPQDRSHSLDELAHLLGGTNWTDVLSNCTSGTVSVGRSQFEYPDFEPFRPPSLLTTNEGYLGRILASELTVQGDWSVDQLPQIQRSIAKGIAAKWSEADVALQMCSVRISPGRQS
jgi:hypothetical protein